MKRTIVVNDRMQKGYVDYRTAPVGRNFAPGFDPQLALTDARAWRPHASTAAGRVGCR